MKKINLRLKSKKTNQIKKNPTSTQKKMKKISDFIRVLLINILWINCDDYIINNEFIC